MEARDREREQHAASQVETREAALAERDKEARERERERDALQRKMAELEAREQELLREVETGKRRERALEKDLEAERSKGLADKEKGKELAAAVHAVKAQLADAGLVVCERSSVSLGGACFSMLTMQAMARPAGPGT